MEISEESLNPSSSLCFSEERFEFVWPGKREAEQSAFSEIKKELRLCRAECLGRDGVEGKCDSENRYIQGDNLDALKLLLPQYEGKIRMIYIDPPYNTGNDFVYNDDFSSKNSGFSQSDGHPFFKNREESARLHSKWLCMLYPRLILAQRLLSDDGAIFISIDEGESDNVKKICAEIFGEQNFVNMFMWLHGKGKKNAWSRTLQQYVAVYAKNKEKLSAWKDIRDSDYPVKNPDNDQKGGWFSGSLSFSEKRSNPNHKNFYTVESPGKKKWTRQWFVSKVEMQELIKNGDVFFGSPPNYDKVPRKKIRPGERISIIPENIISDCPSTRSAQRHLSALFGSLCFTYPKPPELIMKFMSFMQLKDGIVLDFFSGSASSAEAVMCYNKKYGAKVTFIMVQLPEKLSDCEKTDVGEVSKNAVNYLTKKKLPLNLCEIGKERIRLSSKKIRSEIGGAELYDAGFTVYEIV